jgi:transcriptional regulator with XRE-family HTH domain
MLIQLPPIEPELQVVGERLRGLRQARGLETGALAEAMGVSRETLALAERGRARLSAGELHRATLALRTPMRLLFESSDLSQIRPL